MSLLNKYFGGVAKSDERRANSDEVNTVQGNSKFKHVVNKENAVQSALRIGKVLFNFTHPDYYGFRVMFTILGGYFGSRLMSNLREDRGYTYGINARLISYLNEGYFFIASQVGVEVTNKAIKEIYKEILRLKQDKVQVNELDLVKNYMLGNFLRTLDGPFAQADMIKTLIDFNLKDDYYDKYLQKIKDITPDEIMELAGKYLQLDSMYEIVAGKK